MLNELYALNESMRSAGIARQSWHKDYGPCPKNRTFLLLLGSDGFVADIEPVSDECRKSLRKWEVSSGTSFPSFNVLPLLHAVNQEAKDKVEALKKMLKTRALSNEGTLAKEVDALSEVSEKLWVESEGERINRCLQSHPANFSNFLGEAPQGLEAMRELICRASLLDVEKLWKGLKDALVKRIHNSPANPNEWIDTLLVTSAARKSMKKVSLVLELADRSLFQYPANHEKVQAWVNSCLMAKEMQDSPASGASERDAFGQQITNTAGTFPVASIPRLGKVRLRAMSSESPCQFRYAKADSESFPTDAKVRQAMKDSLEWLANQERRGKTWQDVSEACGYDNGILLVYPSTLQTDPPELAEIFAGEESNDGEGTKFEAAAARITPALEGIVKAHPGVEIRLFALAKPDGYRTKVLVSKSYSASLLIAAARDWQKGCQNIPNIKLSVGTRDKPKLVEPIVPFPTEVVKCLNVAWLEDGARTKAVHGLGFGDGIVLLMESGPVAERILERALYLAVTNARSMLIAIGHADHRRDSSLRLDGHYHKHANLLPCVLGLLLHKLNFTKGGYMHTAPFLVGRMLALADTLHKEYCRHVRKGEIPPQLIGNALMPVAIDNPQKGLVRLRERLMVYQAWANKTHGEDNRLAKWTLSHMGTVSNELAGFILPDRTNDADKAQMLLGYLSRFESKGSDEAEVVNSKEEA